MARRSKKRPGLGFAFWLLFYLGCGFFQGFLDDKDSPPPSSLELRRLTRDPAGPRFGLVTPSRDQTLPKHSDFFYRLSDESEENPGGHGRLWYGQRSFSSLFRKPYTITAMGMDKRHHPANAYLTHFIPFPTETIWVPDQFVTQSLRYFSDEKLLPARYPEIWQTSRQTYKNLGGDCEDHAILLADWLIELGYDARVVLGQAGTEGHAWVVLFHEGTVYLLDGTDKRPRQVFPYAKHNPQYHPLFMFNQESMWMNEGTPLTTDYAGPKWAKISSFTEMKAAR